MLRRLLVVGLAWACLGVPAARAATVAIFYYPWYGTPARDGAWQHWNQNGHHPPRDVYSSFYPARGPYSSSDPKVVASQMADIRAAGVDEVITSWWGRGSPEDRRLRLVLRDAHADGLRVALHLEPYPGRSAQTIAGDLEYAASLGIRDVFVYHPLDLPSAQWRTLLGAKPAGMHVFAGTDDVGVAVQGGFDGFYTYDFVTYGAAKFRRLCTEAHRAGILCAPSVGPGHSGVRAGESAAGNRSRRDGLTYDLLWQGVLAAEPDYVTITSYNEWGEGTQIEPATPRPGYRSYDGSWGLTGVSASTAYLTRTAYWAARFHSGG